MKDEDTCAQCHDLLPGYVAGTLAHDDIAVIERHLAHCAACRGELAQWRQLADLAHEIDAITASTTWATIQAHLAPDRVARPRWHQTFRLPAPTEFPFASGERFMEFDNRQSDSDLITSRITPSRLERRPRRRTGIMASVAAILLIVLGATVFALRPHRGAATPGTNVHITPSPTSAPALLLPGGLASDILSPDDIWATGLNMPGTNAQGFNSQIIHFDGSHLQAVATYTGTELKGISMVSATDGWVVGVIGPEDSSTAKPLVLHYTGGHWVTVTLPNPAFLPYDVKMFSANDGWFFGHEGNKEAAFHYVNGAWNAATVNLPILNQIQMLSDTEGWATSDSQNQHGTTLWRYHDGQWSDFYTTSSPVPSFGANSPTDVWLVVLKADVSDLALAGSGKGYAASRPASGGLKELLHYDGSGWTTVQLPSVVGINPPQFFGEGQWIGVDNIATALHFQNGQWSPTTLPIGNQDFVVNIVPQTDGGALALTQGDSVANGAIVNSFHVLRYSNGAWAVIH